MARFRVFNWSFWGDFFKRTNPILFKSKGQFHNKRMKVREPDRWREGIRGGAVWGEADYFALNDQWGL